MRFASFGWAGLLLASLCVPAATQEGSASGVTVSLSPTAQRGGPGLHRGYTLNVSTTGYGNYFLSVSSPGAGWIASIYPTQLEILGSGTAAVAIVPPSTAYAGVYAFTVSVWDGYVNRTVQGTYEVIPPPSPPGKPTLVLDRGSVRVSWTASISPISSEGIRYTVLRDGVGVRSTTSTSAYDSNVPSGEHVYRIRAADAVGNTSLSAAATIVVPGKNPGNIEQVE